MVKRGIVAFINMFLNIVLISNCFYLYELIYTVYNYMYMYMYIVAMLLNKLCGWFANKLIDCIINLINSTTQ